MKNHKKILKEIKEHIRNSSFEEIHEELKECGLSEETVDVPKHVIEEIKILCNLVIDNSHFNPIEMNSAKAILKNLK